ncbi:hypothetical protein E2C01_019937 [Portunus trituberculatus]|uniref:Uncharacterized protein n=1 Tax=Portunus trituberculatus TaxID=210409 RepID=A0A5B7E0D2_PORTR|nr:hypothetical protein [Portunus trituberculatus]
MVDITGRVTALSHSFRVLDGFMFFLKLDSGGETEHILVKEPKFQEWHLVVERGKLAKANKNWTYRKRLTEVPFPKQG